MGAGAMRRRACALWALLVCTVTLADVAAQQPPESEPAAGGPTIPAGRWKVLLTPPGNVRGVRPLPQNAPLKPLPELKFTGPGAGHPFVLGDFAADGRWGLGTGGVRLVEGRNAALSLGRAEDFELEGTLEMGGEGGWFLLVGWDQGRGYSIINIGFRESPSPWFITEYRGNRALETAHQEVGQFEWRRSQPFKLRVQDQELNLQVGRVNVLEGQRLEHYSVGEVVLGVYDTRYGPRPLLIRALRIRGLE